MATDSSLLSFLGHNKYVNAKKQLNTQNKLAYLLSIVMALGPLHTEIRLSPRVVPRRKGPWWERVGCERDIARKGKGLTDRPMGGSISAKL